MGLYGRSKEQAAISALLDAARSGTGGVLVLAGEPGAGKSKLLQATVRAATEMTVLRTAGIETEAPLAFAALHRLLHPLLPLRDQLPAPQARALGVAFGEVDGDVDRFLVFLGALSLLAEAGSQRPVLAVIDDAQWLDDASGAALLFIARRVQVESVALLFGLREGESACFDSAGLTRLRLPGLDLQAVSDLLAERSGGVVSADVSAQLLASTGGNPLALVELPEVLTAAQLQGTEPLPGRLPVTEGVERVFLERARGLSPPAQQLLLVASADDSMQVSTVLRAAGRLGVEAGALTEVERSGLISVSDDQLMLRHPLVRSAVYAASPTADRLAVHAALASVLIREVDADRRAWHRSASVVEPDETVVEELVDAAFRAQRRGGYEAASAAWARAAELSTAPGPRGQRLYQAALASWAAGHFRKAGEQADAALRESSDPLVHADARRLRARVEWNTGSLRLAHRMLLEAARDVAPYDQARARETAAEALAIAAFGGDSGVAIDPASFSAPTPSEAPARQRCYAQLLHGLRHVVTREWPQAVPPLRQAFETARELESDYELLPNLAIAALHVGDLHRAQEFLERLLTEARNSGVVVMVLYALTRLEFSDLAFGEWSNAVGHASEALALGEATGHRVLAGAPRAWLLLLAALRDDDTFETLAEDLERVTSRESAGVLDVVLRDIVYWAHGVRSSAHPPTAFHQFARMSLDLTKRAAALDRIEAAVRVEQLEAARLWIDDLEVFADATGHRGPAAIAQHGRALMAGDEDAESHFKQALELHGAERRSFDRARTQLAYGAFLRRSRRRVDARVHLKAASETFSDLQAGGWAERAAQELRASGETVRKRDLSAATQLTPQERQVAQLVKRGLSNREAAAQLFVSPRTVDFHLRNVFAKTGVSSRVELVGLDLD